MDVKKPKVGIIGGGAVGLTYAAFISEIAEVVVKTRRVEQADLIKAQGISLKMDGKEEAFKNIDASAVIESLASCSAVIVTVKTYDTEHIAEELSRVLRPDTSILTLQNGIVALDTLKANIKNPHRIFAGVTYIGAARIDDRSVTLGNNRRTVIDGSTDALVTLLEQIRFGVEPSANIKQAVWDKMVLNTGQNALSAVTDLHLGQMLQSDQCLDIAEHLLEELQEVAQADGVSLDYSLIEKLKDNWAMSTFYPSMWQDLHKGNQTEIDAINGAISELGKKYNLPTPYNDMITSLIKIKEQRSTQ